MPPRAHPDSVSYTVLRGCRSACLNIFVPLLLAWVVANGVHQFLHASDIRNAHARENSFGPIRLRLKLPGTAAGIPEPLLVCGKEGNACLVYIRLLRGNRARVGVDIWGLRADQGDVFPLAAADAEIDVACYFPAFYPEIGKSEWANMSPDFQRLRRSQYMIVVDGIVRLKAPLDYEQPAHSAVYIGKNPLGGSLVSEKFTGTVLRVSQGY
jgi:hypothetical protein